MPFGETTYKERGNASAPGSTVTSLTQRLIHDLSLMCWLYLVASNGWSIHFLHEPCWREGGFFPFLTLCVSAGSIGGGPGLLEWNPSRPQALPSSQQTAFVFQRVHTAVSGCFQWKKRYQHNLFDDLWSNKASFPSEDQRRYRSIFIL